MARIRPCYAWVVTALAWSLCAHMLAAAEDWSGTITLVESLSSEDKLGGSDRAELDEYARLLRERWHKTQSDVVSAPLSVARVLRQDIGTYEAELDRVVLATGEVVRVATTTFSIQAGKMVVGGDGPRLLIDRNVGKEYLFANGGRQVLDLAPMPPPHELDKSAPELTVLGLQARKLTMRAEGKNCTVIVAPGLPNPYSIGLLTPGPDDKDTTVQKDSIAQNLAMLPGLPLLVEYHTDQVIHRFEVTKVERGTVTESFNE